MVHISFWFMLITLIYWEEPYILLRKMENLYSLLVRRSRRRRRRRRKRRRRKKKKEEE